MSDALVEIGRYARRVRASAERVWENVHDWEHLPHLHAGSFRAIDCTRADASGWRARVALASGGEIDLELALDGDCSSYHSRTLAGPGAGSDIWTRVSEVAADATDVAVSFLAPDSLPPPARAPLGAALERLYARLWDEDEAMMRARQAFLDGAAPRVARPGPRAPVPLGPAAALRASCPRVLDVAGDRFVVREHAGALVAHAAVCPHWGASLEGARLEDGAVVCPWHGYRFDLASGRGPAGQHCRMPARARLRVDERGEAKLEIS
jgi:nitrite reductase/ring-hydroxylating ferredoxin subunit